MKTTIVNFLGVLLFSGIAQGQQKYWVYPKSHGHCKPALRQCADALGTTPVVVSEWLGAYSAILDEEEAKTLRNHPLIKYLQPISRSIKLLGSHNASAKDLGLGKAPEQMRADTLIALGLSGKGVKIGVIDAGFLDADKEKMLDPIRDSSRVAGYKNYIEPHLDDPYEQNPATNDRHGTKVLKFLAGKSNDRQAGLAYNAYFYLARTDQADKEYHGEEDYWVAALEWMYDEGVRLVNSSLGYSDGFDRPDEDYTPANVDGAFSAITRATEIATREKNMTIVIAAGNDGNGDFGIISIPADADGVISVGATGFEQWYKLGYSAVGPPHLQAVKPEVACYAQGGTSFAAPAITGLVACMKELKPEWGNEDIVKILKKSSHLYPYPNNYLGYGVPDAHRIITLINDSTATFRRSRSLMAVSDTVKITFDTSPNIVAFHKRDHYIVDHQEKLRRKNGEVMVFRHRDSAFTTVATEELVWEIKWPEVEEGE